MNAESLVEERCQPAPPPGHPSRIFCMGGRMGVRAGAGFPTKPFYPRFLNAIAAAQPRTSESSTAASP